MKAKAGTLVISLILLAGTTVISTGCRSSESEQSIMRQRERVENENQIKDTESNYWWIKPGDASFWTLPRSGPSQ